MFNRQALAHVVHQLSIRGVFLAEAALNRALAHRKLRGHFGKRRHGTLDPGAEERQDTPTDASARGQCLQPPARVAFEHVEQSGIGGDKRGVERHAAVDDRVLGVLEADRWPQDAEMLDDRGRSTVAKRDLDRIERADGEPLERYDGASSQGLHHLPRVSMQITVDALNRTESADGVISAFDKLDVQPVVEERRIAGQAVERLTGGPATQDHVADDAERARIVGLGGVQTDVGIARQLNGERPQPLHERRGDARVRLTHDSRIDAGRAAYIGEWMALALEEAKKINHQRGRQRRFTHRLECTVRTVSASRNRVVLGGASLVAATILFAAVFSYLAATFDYPDVLDRPAGDVLPALLALGTTGRIIWLVYGVIPLLLVPTALGVNEAARVTAPRLGRAVVWLAGLSALAMMAGLLRWPTLQWTLAQEWMSATPASREVIASRFATANLYLGNVIGEFVGELFLNGFFLLSSLALSARRQRRRWLAFSGVAASTLGWIAMLRNVTPLVAPIATLNNVLLPVWMLTLGLALAVSSRPAITLRRPEDARNAKP